MFEVGFSELLLIFALALIVLGPERLPRVAAQVGRWIGRARSIARQFREQLEEEINLEEQKASRPKPAEANTAAASAAAGAAASATEAAATDASASPAATEYPGAAPETPPQHADPFAGMDTSNIPYAHVGSPVFDDPAAPPVTAGEPATSGAAAAGPVEPLPASHAEPAPPDASTDPTRAAHERGT